jgi:SAM-dependent methyltransferase
MKRSQFKAISSQGFTWGFLFAGRANFDFGYLEGERYLVDKYFNKRNCVLIIGSGNGREARPICRQAKTIVCIDTGWLYLMSGKQLFKSERIGNTHFVQADMFQLPFAKKSFDFVFFSMYSFAARRRFEVLRHIRDLLKPDGLVLLLCGTPLYEKISRQRKVHLPHRVTCVRSAGELRREISLCGFRMLESQVDSKRPEYRYSLLQATG